MYLEEGFMKAKILLPERPLRKVEYICFYLNEEEEDQILVDAVLQRDGFFYRPCEIPFATDINGKQINVDGALAYEIEAKTEKHAQVYSTKYISENIDEYVRNSLETNCSYGDS